MLVRFIFRSTSLSFKMCGKIFSYNFLLLHGIIFLENVLHLSFVFPFSFPLPSYFIFFLFGKSFYLFCGIKLCLSLSFTIESGISMEFVLFVLLVAFGCLPWREGGNADLMLLFPNQKSSIMLSQLFILKI